MTAKQITAIVLTADQLGDMELFFPLCRVIEAGWQVDVAAPSHANVGDEHGYGLKPDRFSERAVCPVFAPCLGSNVTLFR